jgi:hypothetical protein
MLIFFSPGGVEELYPKLVGLSLEELSTVVEPFGSGIVGPASDERGGAELDCLTDGRSTM